MPVVAVLVAVRLRVHRAAARPGRRPSLRRLRVSGFTLLHVRHLPAGHRVPGPRHGDLANALPLNTSAKHKTNHSRLRRRRIVYLLKPFRSQLVGTG